MLTNREHIIALEPLDKGLMGTLLRYPYEVRSEEEYFDEIQDVKVTKDMLDLAKHIVNQKSGRFEPEKFGTKERPCPNLESGNPPFRHYRVLAGWTNSGHEAGLASPAGSHAINLLGVGPPARLKSGGPCRPPQLPCPDRQKP